MNVLVDHEINARLLNVPPLATNVPLDNYLKSDSRIQAASLDLTVGDIFLPASDKNIPSVPLSELTLLQGHTAVIRTLETLNVGNDLVGIAFPPSSVSLQGLLMTNPGQVDPGYSGQLHLTVINMSHVPFQLRKHDRIMRVIFLKLNDTPSAGYADRRTNPVTSPITPRLLARLSADFLNVENRARKIAKRTVRNAQVISGAISAAVALLITVLVTFAPSWLSDRTTLKDEVGKLEARVTVVEGRSSEAALNARIQKIEETISKLPKTK